jgi:hypothetical protein
VHGAATGEPSRSSRPDWDAGSRFSPTHSSRIWQLAYAQPSLITLTEHPLVLRLTAARRAAHSLATVGRAQLLHVPGADADGGIGDRDYLVLAKPNVIMNDIRLRGLAVAGSKAAGRKSPHNHAQTARNLKRSLRNAAAGARLIQAEGLDSKSAADLATSLADALTELRRLERRLDRRIRRDQGGRKRAVS